MPANADKLQLRRGTTAKSLGFKGAPGEITVDTDLATLRVHDGRTLGGSRLATKAELDAAVAAAVPDGDKGDITVAAGVWTIDALAVTDAKVAAANKDGAVGTASMRTLGTGAQQAAAGDHAHAGTYAPLAHTHAEADVTGLVADLALRAPLASPTFTGVPAMPTAAPGTNTTQGATTAFVTAAVAAVGGLSDGDKGDIVVSGSGAVWTLDTGVVTAAAKTVLDDGTVGAMLATLGGQPLDAALTSIAALGTAADKMLYTTGVDTFAEAALTAAGRAILDDADAAAQRTTLGLGSLATLSAVGSAQITDGSVTYADLQDVTARSVVGRSAATDGVTAAITAGSDGDILRRAAGVVGFGSVPAASVTGLATVATSGSAADLGSGTLLAGRMPALTGDVTTSAGAVATTIGAAKVTSAMLRDSAAVSVIGRSVNSSGVPADIAAGADGDVLRRAAGVVGFGSIPESSVTSLVADLALKAPLASPTLTGTPAAPTAAGGTNTTQVATTAFVASEIATAAAAYQPLDADLTALAASPATAGLVERTGAAAYTTRLIGVANATDVPTRADADTRYASATGLAAGQHVVGVDTTIAAGYGVSIPRYFEVSAGFTLGLGAGADLEVT